MVSFKGTCNARLPLSYFKDQILENEVKCLGHIIKIDPSKPWGDIQIHVNFKERDAIPAPPKGNTITPGAIFIGEASHLGCGNCSKLNSMAATKCEECGHSLIPGGVSVGLDTNTLSSHSQMDGYFDIDL